MTKHLIGLTEEQALISVLTGLQSIGEPFMDAANRIIEGKTRNRSYYPELDMEYLSGLGPLTPDTELRFRAEVGYCGCCTPETEEFYIPIGDLLKDGGLSNALWGVTEEPLGEEE